MVTIEDLGDVEPAENIPTTKRETLEVGDEDTIKQRIASQLRGADFGAVRAPVAGSTTAGPQRTSTFGKVLTATTTDTSAKTEATPQASTPSLMEQMMAEAAAAKDTKVQEEKERKKSFGNGLKKGFLSSGSSKKKATGNSTKTPASNSNEKLTGLQTSSTLLNAGTGNAQPRRSAASLVGSAAPSAGVVLPEVQAAMESNPGNVPWLTPELLSQLASRPQVMAAFQSPLFSEYLRLIEKNPEAAQKCLERDPESKAVMLELAGILGKHFEKLGAAQDAAAAEEEKKKREALGPLAQKALSKYESDIAAGGEAAKQAKKQMEASTKDDDVQKILADKELYGILTDVKIQQVIQDCSGGGSLHRHMRDAETGPKLRKLIEAGLLKVE